MIKMGCRPKNMVVAIVASLGVILGAVYMLWLYKRVIFGRIVNSELKKITDLNKIELYIFLPLVFLILLFGFYPEPLLNTINVSTDNLIKNYQLDLDYYLLKSLN